MISRGLSFAFVPAKAIAAFCQADSRKCQQRSTTVTSNERRALIDLAYINRIEVQGRFCAQSKVQPASEDEADEEERCDKE